MKKFLAILSLVAFVAVNVSVAQAPQATKETKKETVVKAEEKSTSHSCCKGGSMKNCSAEQMKNCTPAQKAACNHGDKAKADAGAEKKEGTKANNN
jgi:hypothetical protein